MARSKNALKDFLVRHCRIHPSPASVDEQEYYLFLTADGRHFMTESHLREIFRALGQSGDVTASSQENTGNILIELKEAPDKGINVVRIPVKLIDSLNEKQTFLILRNLQCIQADIEEGRICRDRLESLFGDTATIRLATGEDGQRIFDITGKLSSTDQKRYMERYAEQVASRTLFDIAKALNGKLAQYVPEESREKFFIEGRDFSDRKIRYGEEVGTELVLSDEGACVYTTLVHKNPLIRENVAKILQRAMTDPFGLSMTHYMGKHNVLKAGKRPLVKVPGISGFFSWLKGLFGGGNKT
jgi:hypothetical protein